MEIIIKDTLIKSENNTRNVGIDLLKSIATFMVIILHILGAGGILKNGVPFSANNNAAWFLEIISYGAVNLFALSTGYVYVTSKYRFSKIISLWLQVFFYSAVLTLLFFVISPETVGVKQLIKSFLPIMTKQYWYFSSYFCLFIFIPFINILIKNLTKNDYQKLILGILITFCGLGWISSIFNIDVFGLENGYSFLWLMSLYFIGAYIKLYEKDFKRNDKIQNILIYLITTLLTFIMHTLFQKIKFEITGTTSYGSFCVSYISPLIVIASIQLFLFFSKLEIKKIQKYIVKLSNLSFGIFLMHCQEILYVYFLTNAFINYTKLHWLMLIIKVLSITILIYLSAAIIEYLRIHLFKKMKINKLYENSISKIFQEKIQNIFEKKLS